MARNFILLLALLTACDSPVEAGSPPLDGTHAQRVEHALGQLDQGFLDDETRALTHTTLARTWTGPDEARLQAMEQAADLLLARADLAFTHSARPADAPEYDRIARASFEAGAWRHRSQAMDVLERAHRLASQLDDPRTAELEARLQALEAQEAEWIADRQRAAGPLLDQIEALETVLERCPEVAQTYGDVFEQTLQLARLDADRGRAEQSPYLDAMLPALARAAERCPTDRR